MTSLIRAVCHAFSYLFSLKDIRFSLALEATWIAMIICQIVQEDRIVFVFTAMLSLINLIGLAAAACFYRHNVRLVLNCTPRWTSPSCIWEFLGFIRPLEMIWRFVTYRFRVLPDLLLVGEVRCGTTSFAGSDHFTDFAIPKKNWIPNMQTSNSTYQDSILIPALQPRCAHTCRCAAPFHRGLHRSPRARNPSTLLDIIGGS